MQYMYFLFLLTILNNFKILIFMISFQLLIFKGGGVTHCDVNIFDL